MDTFTFPPQRLAQRKSLKRKEVSSLPLFFTFSLAKTKRKEKEGKKERKTDRKKEKRKEIKKRKKRKKGVHPKTFDKKIYVSKEKKGKVDQGGKSFREEGIF